MLKSLIKLCWEAVFQELPSSVPLRAKKRSFSKTFELQSCQCSPKVQEGVADLKQDLEVTLRQAGRAGVDGAGTRARARSEPARVLES